MPQKYHNNAKLTKAQREAIQKIAKPNFSKLAKELGVSRQTVAKWWRRLNGNDKSSKRENIKYSLTEEQKAWLLNLYLEHKYTVEELHNYAKKIGIEVSHSTIYRCVRENIIAIFLIIYYKQCYYNGHFRMI